MIIYEATKEEFCDSVLRDAIVDDIYTQYQSKIGKTNKNEIRSWENSMQYMNKVLNTEDIPNNSGVAIEYNIPLTSKRIDFLLSGKKEEDSSSVVVVELKQWELLETVDNKDGIVRTFLGGGIREHVHPSYQAWSYVSLIKDFNETVQKESIDLYPCAYLHNYDRAKNKNNIEDSVYREYFEKAPVFAKGDVLKLRDFIKKYIKKGDDKKILYEIDKGKIRPSKVLQDSLSKMLKGNKEFQMIDTQKLVYENALNMGRKSKKDNKKRVLIVEGGPGTGKSVIAINLLVQFIKEGIVSQYITKNAAPRNIYKKLLRGDYTQVEINSLFNSPGSFIDSQKNDIDALIADEAHRLNEKSGMFKNLGENQIKEIIFASKFSIFFIDENQKIDINDIGNINEICKIAKKNNVFEIEKMQLDSQFRCSGSDGYISWIDDVLDIKNTANFDGFEKFDFQVIENPCELRKLILEKNVRNKARLLAGYCWNWKKDERGNTDYYDINIPEYDFKMSWNLDTTITYAIDTDSINQVGCIHTSQGLEFDYVGVIIGEDLRFENDQIITDFTKRAKTDNSLKGIRKIYGEDPRKALKIADNIIKNTYRTLLTRGQKGCYVYCVNKDLQEYFKTRLTLLKKYDS